MSHETKYHLFVILTKHSWNNIPFCGKKLSRKMRILIDEFDEKYDDAGSSDFITGIMKEHEKMAWMLRAHLK